MSIRCHGRLSPGLETISGAQGVAAPVARVPEFRTSRDGCKSRESQETNVVR